MRYERFVDLLRQIGMYEEGGVSIDEVATKGETARGNVYDYLEGRRTAPPEFVRRVLAADLDPRLLAWFIPPSYVYYKAPCDIAELTPDLLDGILRVQEEHLHVVREATAALRNDGRITPDELEVIQQEGREAMAATASLLHLAELAAKRKKA